MYRVDDILERCNDENIKAFNVNFSVESINEYIKFEDIDEFFAFMKISGINHVYVMQVYEDMEDYLISDEVVEEVLGRYGNHEILETLSSDIDDYNNQISKLDIDYPSMIFVACAYEGQMFFVCLENEIVLGENGVCRPEDILKEMLVENEDRILEIQENRNKLIEEQKQALKEFILKDKEFYLSTNAHLRYAYAQNLFKRVGKGFDELIEHWTTPYGLPANGVKNLVEMLWKEYGKTKK